MQADLIRNALAKSGHSIADLTAEALSAIGCTAAATVPELQLRLGLWLIHTPHPPTVRTIVAALVYRHMDERGAVALPS